MFKHIHATLKATRYTFLVLLFGVVLVFQVYKPAYGLYLSQRTILVGSPVVGAVTTHDFTFVFPDTNPVGSMRFEYCTNSPLVSVACAAPSGMNMQAAAISAQTGVTGFSVDPGSTVNALLISRPSAPATAVPARYLLSNVTNPTNPNATIFVRVTTYVSIDGTGPVTDQGSMAFSTSGGLGTGGFVPPYLTICVAVTVQPDCSAVGDQLIGFGEFSSHATRSSTSQFAVATNDPSGYGVFLNGQTMTAGNLIILPLSLNDTSHIGTGQFGLNIRSNSTPTVGADVTGSGSGVVDANYNTPNSYRFNDGELIAHSPLPSDFNRYTVSYIVNINGSQGPGFYATTMTYTAVVAF